MNKFVIALCKGCNIKKRLRANGMCSTCYSKTIKKIIKCEMCKEYKPHEANNLCRTCYGKYRYNLLIKKEPAILRIKSKKWEDKNKNKKKVQNMVKNAIVSGKIIRTKICSICCAEGIIQAHHKDYTKPFDITWLCRKCHNDIHKEDMLRNCKKFHLNKMKKRYNYD